jgi:hypothetical protein
MSLSVARPHPASPVLLLWFGQSRESNSSLRVARGGARVIAGGGVTGRTDAVAHDPSVADYRATSPATPGRNLRNVRTVVVPGARPDEGKPQDGP